MAFDGYKDPAYNTAAYRRARLQCLRRARWKCERQLPGICAGTASQANHRQGIANDPRHTDLEAICKPCHKQVTNEQSNTGRVKAAADPRPQPRTAW